LSVILCQNEITLGNEYELGDHNKALKVVRENKMLNRNMLLIIACSLLGVMLISCSEMLRSTKKR